jgi:hypothetical protein
MDHRSVTSDEILVIDFKPDVDAPSWPVTSSAPPRVAVLQAPRTDLETIAAASRLALARDVDGAALVVGDQGVLDELDAGARLFVDAWRSQPRSKPDRPGDGLPWDAKGFEPPDPPTG